MENIFGHEKLEAYKLAIEFDGWLVDLIETKPDQEKTLTDLRRISSSISVKIAEGNARFSLNERFALFDNAIDLAIGSAVALDILVAEGVLTVELIQEGKDKLKKIVEEIGKLRS